MKFFRVQCFDGATSVRENDHYLKVLISKEQQRTIYIHLLCVAHWLNLVVQDALQDINMIWDFTDIEQNLINFVQDCPKRLAFFSHIQCSEAENNENFSPYKLIRFYQIRYYINVKFLVTIVFNYPAINFFGEISENKSLNSFTTASFVGLEIK